MPTPPRAALGGLLHAASGKLWTLGDRALAPLGVTSAQWKVLVVLGRSGDSRVNALAQTLEQDQGAVSRLVLRLEAAGLVEHLDDPSDTRAGVVRLTARGRKTFAACDAVLSEVMDRMTAKLGSKKTAAFLETLARFSDLVAEELERLPPARRS